MVGLPAVAVSGRRDLDVLPAARAAEIWQRDRAVLAQGRPAWRPTMALPASAPAWNPGSRRSRIEDRR